MSENAKLPITQRSTFLRFGRWLFSWRGIRTMFLILVWPITLVALFYGIENWRSSRAWKKCSEELQAKGAILEFSAIVPKQIPDDRNFAAIPMIKAWFEKATDEEKAKRWNDNYYRAAQRVDQYRTKDRQRAITDLVSWQMAFAAAASADSNQDERVLSFPNADAAARAEAGREILKQMEHFENLFSELRQAATRPESRYPINYAEANPWAIMLPHLANIRAVGDRLNLQASAELATGQIQKAQEDIRLLMALADSLRQEPFLISYLVRVKSLNIALQPLWEGIRLHQWTEPQLEQFQTLLANYNLLEGVAPCLQTERAAALVTIDFIRANGSFEMFGTGSSGEGGEPWPDLLTRIAPRGWFDFEKVNYCQLEEIAATTGWDAKTLRVSPKEVEEAKATVERSLNTTPIKRLFEHKFTAGMLLPALSKVIERGAAAQTLFNQAVIACALERYRLTKGGYPETLDALRPAGFINTLPHDVLTGEAMKYQKIGDQQFTLYSIGWNGKDDGGKTGKTTYDDVSGDWVW